MIERLALHEPVRGTISCGGVEHEIGWDAGDLTLFHHDIDAEKALAALGGEACECIRVFDAWTTSDPLTDAAFLRPEGELPLSRVIENNLQYVQMAQNRYLPSTHPAYVHALDEAGVLERQLCLAQLPRALRDRFCLELIVAVSDLIDDDQAGPLMEEALSARANASLEMCMRSWRRIDHASFITVEAWLCEEDEPPSIVGWATERSGMAAASLPIGWLIDVWGHGLALVDDCFILSVIELGSDTGQVIASRWERTYGSDQMQTTLGSISGSPDKWDSYFRDWSTPIVSAASINKSSSGKWRLTWGS
ncbi:MAG: hypothetical protein ABR507_04595 [Actinomycetota bacterium]|nr:hypothetical protein [Actinomycetota bacterium]